MEDTPPEDASPTPPRASWNPKVPFSARALPPTVSPQPKAGPPSSSQPKIRPPEPTEVIRVPVSQASSFDDVSTGPIPVQSEPPKSKVKRVFSLLSPEELSESEFRDVRKLMTAYYNAQLLLEEKRRGEKPTPYEERFFIWKMLFQQLVPIGALLVIFPVTLAIRSWMEISGLGLFWMIVGLFVTTLLSLWFVCRIFYAWRHTFLFSNTEETGIRKPRKRWLLLNANDQTIETSSIKKKDVTQGSFASTFNINSWRASFDTAVQTDKFVHDLRFVRNGDKLMKTVQANQNYVNHRGR